MTTEPSLDYKNEVEAIDNIVRACMAVSLDCAGIRAPTAAHYYASILFTSLCTRAVSLAILTPHSPWAKKEIEHWDHSSIAGIVRSILEVRLAFFYLCVESCSSEEWECRWNLFNLHDCSSRIHLFQEMASDEKKIDGFVEQAEQLRARLTNNAFFMGLSSKDRNRLIKGGHAYLSSLEDIAARAGIDLQTFRWIYKLFSSQVHCLPMSFYRMGDLNRGRGIHSKSEENFTSICLTFAFTLLAAARKEMKALFAATKEA